MHLIKKKSDWLKTIQHCAQTWQDFDFIPMSPCDLETINLGEFEGS